MEKENKIHKKFLVMNQKHFFKLDLNLRNELTLLLNKAYEDLKEMGICNNYYVVNQDEIYAPIVRALILLYEDIKNGKITK